MSLPLDSTASNMEIASSSGSPSKLVYLRTDCFEPPLFLEGVYKHSGMFITVLSILGNRDREQEPGIPFNIAGDSVDAQVNKAGMRDLLFAHAPLANKLDSPLS